jgi:hypothetical protein
MWRAMAFVALLLACNLAPIDGRRGAFEAVKERGLFCVEKRRRRKIRPLQMKSIRISG